MRDSSHTLSDTSFCAVIFIAFLIFLSVASQTSDKDIFSLQSHSFFTSLCAITILNDAGIRNGCTPILRTLVIVSDALLVCIVDSTRCHVKDASIAISTVSLSLISHTMMISGSSRTACFMPTLKSTTSIPTSRWLIKHLSSVKTNSIGSSSVKMCLE